MLQDDKLKALFELLKKMTNASPTNPVPPRSRFMQGAQTVLACGFLITTFVFFATAAWYWSRSSKPPHGVSDAARMLYVIGLLMACAYVILLTIESARAIWRQRHERAPVVLSALEADMRMDTTFLTDLWAFDKPTLEYGLLQYRHRWSITDRRLGSIAGNIRNLGLFPALMAATMSIATLVKDDSDFKLWLPPILALALYLVVFFATNQRERPDQVIALLEYAIRYANDPPASVRIDIAPARPASEPPAPPGEASFAPVTGTPPASGSA